MIYSVESMPMLLRVLNAMISDGRASKVDAEIKEFEDEYHRGYMIYADKSHTRFIQLYEDKADGGQSVTIGDFDGDGQMFDDQQDGDAVAYVYGLLLGESMRRGAVGI